MAQTTRLALKNSTLSQAEDQALQAFTAHLQRVYSKQIRQVFLFGSKARGDANADSDIDVLVITADDDRALRHAIIDLASDYSLEYGVLLSPRVIDSQRWQTKQGFGVYQNIVRDAQTIATLGDFNEVAHPVF